MLIAILDFGLPHSQLDYCHKMLLLGVFYILCVAIKMTYELPRGVKNNMLRSYLSQDNEQFESCKRIKEWKNLFFSLALLHACLLERKKYGPLGWNIGYNFS